MNSTIFIYNINSIVGHFYILSNSLKILVKILLGKKYKLSIFLCSIILDSLVFVRNNSLE